VSVFCLTGVAVLAARRLREGRPLRRSLTLLVDAFGLALVMIAFLFLSAAYGGPWVMQIRWVTFVTLGLAPAAFVAGLLYARLARSALGDLIVELRADLAPADLRNALARALRDPSLELAYWLPDFNTYVDVDGQSFDIETRGRAITLIERKGGLVAALLHDSSLQDEPELLAAVTAAAGIAVENGRLEAELRARLEELKGSRARVIEAGQKERQRLERNLHDGAQQRLIALSLQLSRLGHSRSGRSRRSTQRPAQGLDACRRRHSGESRDPVRVAIAEDSVLLREGLVRLLDDEGFDVVAQCENGDDLLLKVRSYAPDVAIVDIRLPPTHNDEGLRAALEIRSKHPAVGVLVLSQYVEVGLALKLLADSAEGVGYLLKDRI